MTRTDKFEDQFEGAVCAEEDAVRYNEALTEYYAEMLEGKAVPKDFLDNERNANRLLRMNYNFHEDLGFAACLSKKGLARRS